MAKTPLAITGQTRITTAERRAEAWRMTVAGMNGEQIGKALGVTRQRVHQYLKQTLAELNKTTLDVAADYRAIEDARLEGRLLEINVLVQAHKSDPDIVAKLDARRGAISDAKRRLWGLDATPSVDITSGGERVEIALRWPEDANAGD